MNFYRPLLLLLPMFAVLFLSACGTVPYSGRSQFLLTSQNEENQLGEQAWKELLQTAKISTNPSQNAALNRVGQAVSSAAAKDAPNFHWEFKVIEDQTANAFCLPGGKIAVYSGLFAYAANDAELATVIAHEVSHAIARHSGERISQEMAANVGSSAVSTALESNLAGGLFSIGAQYGAILPYSRQHEYEADYIGLLLMSRAGYDPRAAITFWTKFGKLGNDSNFTVFFSTHPMGSDRLDYMQSKMPEALGFYGQSVQKGLGTIYGPARVSMPTQSNVPASASALRTNSHKVSKKIR